MLLASWGGSNRQKSATPKEISARALPSPKLIVSSSNGVAIDEEENEDGSVEETKRGQGWILQDFL